MIDAYLIRKGSTYLLKCNGKGWLTDNPVTSNPPNPVGWWSLENHTEPGEEIYVCSAETLEELVVNLKMETLMND